MIELFMQPEAWISLLTLCVLEIVLGIDNIIFISILITRLPEHQQDKARQLGMFLALIFRILLLSLMSFLAQLTNPLFAPFDFPISGRDLIMISGGLFLVYKSTSEIHNKLEGEEETSSGKSASFWSIIMQVIILDVVFSLDSVITAIGLVDHLSIMIIAVVLSMIVMFFFSKTISDFIHKHPTMKMLALSFLLMVGMLLFAEGFHIHVPKGYIYFSMAFSIFVEALNLRLRKKSAHPVHLNLPHLPENNK